VNVIGTETVPVGQNRLRW